MEKYQKKKFYLELDLEKLKSRQTKKIINVDIIQKDYFNRSDKAIKT